MSSIDAFLNHPIETLERALHIRKQIDELNEVLKELFGSSPVSLAGVQKAGPSGKRHVRPKKGNKPTTNIAAGGSEAGSGVVVDSASVAKTKKKGGMSAEGRARIVAAQKARWSKVKAEKSTATKAAPAARRKKRKLSPEARARIVAAVKARWARAKNAKK